MLNSDLNARLIGYGFFLLLAYCLILLFSFLPFQLDDAYITYRYSRNFVEHGIFAFNASGENVEGFSSIVWFALAALFGVIFSAELIHYSGVFFGILAYGLLIGLAFYKSGSRQAAFLRAVLLAAMPGLVFYSATGMEAAGYALLVAVFALALCNQVPHWLGLVAAAIAPWFRPESPWFFVMIALVFVLSADRKAQFPALLRYALVLAASFALLLAFRWLVFGDVLPNTYYEKESSVVEGWHYVLELLTTAWFVPLFMLALLSAILGNHTQRILMVLAASWFLVAILEGGDWMQHYRFLLPALVLMVFALDFESWQTSPNVRWFQAGFAVLMVLYLLLATQALRSSAETTHNQLLMGYTEDQWLFNWMEDNAIDSVAAIDIGRLGYFGDWEILDLGGLTDSYIAHLPGKHMQKPIPMDYILERAPSLFIIRISQQPDSAALRSEVIMSPAEAHIVTDPLFLQHYQPLFILAPDYVRDPYYGQVVFVNRRFQSEHALTVDEKWLTYRNGMPFVHVPVRRDAFIAQ